MTKKDTNNHTGWTTLMPEVYHYQHIPLAEAEQKAEAREFIYVLEAINWTIAQSEPEESVHYNRYFAISLSDAVALAARMELQNIEVAEDVVAIRPATDEEERQFWVHWEAEQKRWPG